MTNSMPDTLEHISNVQSRIYQFCACLCGRAHNHDASKLEEPEKSGWDALLWIKSKRDTEYGSLDYYDGLDILGDTLKRHYAANRHHPEHWPNGVNDMSLVDIIEMFCDWKAAGESYKDGNITQSLRVNRDRFGISDQLASIFENTVRELGW